MTLTGNGNGFDSWFAILREKKVDMHEDQDVVKDAMKHGEVVLLTQSNVQMKREALYELILSRVQRCPEYWYQKKRTFVKV